MTVVFSYEKGSSVLSGIPLLLFPMLILMPGPPGPRSFPRDKEPHDPAYNGYPQDDACGNRKKDRKEKGQFEDQKKERDQKRAEQYGQAAGGKILRFQHDLVLSLFPFPGNLLWITTEVARAEDIQKKQDLPVNTPVASSCFKT